MKITTTVRRGTLMKKFIKIRDEIIGIRTSSWLEINKINLIIGYDIQVIEDYLMSIVNAVYMFKDFKNLNKPSSIECSNISPVERYKYRKDKSWAFWNNGRNQRRLALYQRISGLNKKKNKKKFYPIILILKISSRKCDQHVKFFTQPNGIGKIDFAIDVKNFGCIENSPDGGTFKIVGIWKGEHFEIDYDNFRVYMSLISEIHEVIDGFLENFGLNNMKVILYPENHKNLKARPEIADSLIKESEKSSLIVATQCYSMLTRFRTRIVESQLGNLNFKHDDLSIYKSVIEKEKRNEKITLKKIDLDKMGRFQNLELLGDLFSHDFLESVKYHETIAKIYGEKGYNDEESSD